MLDGVMLACIVYAVFGGLLCIRLIIKHLVDKWKKENEDA